MQIEVSNGEIVDKFGSSGHIMLNYQSKLLKAMYSID